MLMPKRALRSTVCIPPGVAILSTLGSLSGRAQDLVTREHPIPAELAEPKR